MREYICNSEVRLAIQLEKSSRLKHSVGTIENFFVLEGNDLFNMVFENIVF